jgi:hypothetical protein
MQEATIIALPIAHKEGVNCPGKHIVGTAKMLDAFNFEIRLYKT